jgi:hypothetical protein
VGVTSIAICIYDVRNRKGEDETWCGEMGKRKEKKELNCGSWGMYCNLMESHVPLSCENLGQRVNSPHTYELYASVCGRLSATGLQLAMQCLYAGICVLHCCQNREEVEIRDV